MKKTIFEQKDKTWNLVGALIQLMGLVGIILLLVLPLMTVDVLFATKSYSFFSMFEEDIEFGVLLVFFGGILLSLGASMLAFAVNSLYDAQVMKLGVTERKAANGKSIKIKARSQKANKLLSMGGVVAFIAGIVLLFVGKSIFEQDVVINGDFVQLGVGAIIALVIAGIQMVAMAIIGVAKMNFVNSVEQIEEEVSE